MHSFITMRFIWKFLLDGRRDEEKSYFRLVINSFPIRMNPGPGVRCLFAEIYVFEIGAA